MNEKEIYLEELNTCFEQYLKTKNLSSNKKLWSKINIGKETHGLVIEDYYSGNQQYSVADFDKSCSKLVKEIQTVKDMWKKVDVLEFKLKIKSSLLTTLVLITAL